MIPPALPTTIRGQGCSRSFHATRNRGFWVTTSRSVGGAVVVQYWHSMDKLYAYDISLEAERRRAWTAFTRRARKAPGAVGIWHEAFDVASTGSIYMSTPVEGLMEATTFRRADLRSERAKDRRSGQQ